MIFSSNLPFIIKYTEGIKNTVVTKTGIEPLAIIFTMRGLRSNGAKTYAKKGNLRCKLAG
ncbi:hypothetical protein EAH77_19130 [Ewingella americana]|uniref:Uncharacterized protein n=1 Tax=Ewingella americana TaxID=41202 RepID=A0A502G9B1_9GAMM|nr:hypothetical protein EAH77_19130 [Ewingella americana]